MFAEGGARWRSGRIGQELGLHCYGVLLALVVLERLGLLEVCAFQPRKLVLCVVVVPLGISLVEHSTTGLKPTSLACFMLSLRPMRIRPCSSCT